MATFRNFDTEFPIEERKDSGPTFELGGENFTCIPAAPAGTVNDLVAGIRSDPNGNEIYSIPNLVSFMRQVLREREWVSPPAAQYEGGVLVGEWQPRDDVTRFMALMYDKDRPIKVEVLGALVIWLAEQYTLRPTTPSGR